MNLLIDPVSDIPRLDRNAYIRAERSVTEGFADDTGIRTIARFGDVRIPGISDLDILIICDDHDYAQVMEKANALRQSIENGPDLFTHQMLVLPVSLAHLRSLLMFDHTFSGFHVLSGSAQELFCPAITREQRAINTLLWDTTIWRILTGLRRRTVRQREGLLLMQTLFRQCALHRMIMQGTSQGSLRWSGIVRRCIALSPVRSHVMSHGIGLALRHWLRSQTRFERWWRREVYAGAYPTVREVPDMLPDCRYSFAASPVVSDTDIRLPWCIADLCAECADLFPIITGVDRAPAKRSEPWQDAWTRYREGVRAAQAWGSARGNPALLFLGEGTGVFPSPGNRFQ